MKYVALLSGGKDSCFNLLHCHKHGHDLLCAATLGPGQGKEELDSYLYQTVGQDAIEFVSRALEVPLYRKVISGDAVEQGSEYGFRTSTNTGGVRGDETEDLYALLSEVKEQHPDVQGVSVGAILSNYQRVRVEHVCRRLSLTPLCYLWQRDQGELLSEMIESGMEAILIKVAGIGLTIKHLGKTLTEMQPTLVKLNSLYGAHICGEGGEYESLTLDCPLFKHHIVLRDVETIIHSDNSFATVAYLRIKNATLDRKPEVSSFDVHVPQILEGNFKFIQDAILETENSIPSNSVVASILDKPLEPFRAGISSRQLDQRISIANIHRDDAELDQEISIEEEVRQCFYKLGEQLAVYSLNLSHCSNVNIFLSSIDDFSKVNTVYATFFGISPPARACVAVDLPPPYRVMLDCVAYAEQSPTERQALHVQSLSYWAPANIGPYSQAITVGQRIFVSGQIGLLPHNLSLPSPQSLALETALAFQHVERVVGVLKNSSSGEWNPHAQSELYWLVDHNHIPQVKTSLDKYQKEFSSGYAPVLYLVVKALPKNALIEKQVLLHTGRCMIIDPDDDEPSLQTRPHAFESFYEHEYLHWEMSRFEENKASSTIICFRDISNSTIATILKSQDVLSCLWTRTFSIRLFYVPSRTLQTQTASFLEELFGVQPPITAVPCRFISSRKADDWDYAMCILTN